MPGLQHDIAAGDIAAGLPDQPAASLTHSEKRAAAVSPPACARMASMATNSAWRVPCTHATETHTMQHSDEQPSEQTPVESADTAKATQAALRRAPSSRQCTRLTASRPTAQPASRAHIACLVGFVAACGHHSAVTHHHAAHGHLTLLQRAAGLHGVSGSMGMSRESVPCVFPATAVSNGQPAAGCSGGACLGAGPPAAAPGA